MVSSRKSSMKYLAPLLIISFIGIGVFGFAFSDMSMGHQGGCIASAIDGTECPTNIAQFATHHVEAIQSLTTTIIPPIGSWLLLLASLLLIGATLAFLYENLLYPKLEFHRSRLRETELNLSHSKQKIISWLALFELSPALL